MLDADKPMRELIRRRSVEEATRHDWQWIDRTRRDRYPY